MTFDVEKSYGTHLDQAAQLTKAQLTRAIQVVSAHSNQIDPATHQMLVAAVTQAMATNFLALRTGR